ncbi:MAG: hypothetical protein ACFCUO_03065 [Rhodospirillales bacterium]
MTTMRILEPSDTLREAVRLAENIKIAFELVEEKSSKQNRKLTYLLRNLSQEIDTLLALLERTMKAGHADGPPEEVECEIVDDDTALSGTDKVM